MAKVEIKKPVVEEIKANLDGAQTAVVVDYRGLTVEQDTQLRKQLREAGVVYKVYKNTMINFAIEGTEFEGLKPCLEGPTGLAICKTDATAAARILANFAKTAPALELKGGVVEGTFYDAAGCSASFSALWKKEKRTPKKGPIQAFCLPAASTRSPRRRGKRRWSLSSRPKTTTIPKWSRKRRISSII